MKKEILIIALLLFPSNIQALENQTLIDDDAIMENPNAPVTMVEFGGFENEFSRSFWKDAFPTIESEYMSTGKVRFVFRDYPTSDPDIAASIAAECVRQQYGDAEYIIIWDGFFSTTDPLTEELINQTLDNLGYDIRNCDIEKVTDEIILDVVDGDRLELNSIPSFFINDYFFEGTQELSVFQEAIEKALNETVKCWADNECNDNNSYTFDTCFNPGLANATCNYQPIRCLKNSNCGNNSLVKFCSNENICNKTTTYTCTNAGTPQSSCTSSVNENCNSCQFGCNNQSRTCKPLPTIIIFSPLQKIYNVSSIAFNLTTGNYSFNKISFIDWSEKRPRWDNVCSNCNEYGINKRARESFDEGMHNLTFKAINGTIEITKNISFFVDSKNPKIMAIEPKSRDFANGSNFFIKYDENNCQWLILKIFGNSSNKTSMHNCSSGTVKKIITENLSIFNNQQIEYQFMIKDKANNTAESRRTKIKVDTMKPIINSLKNSTSDRRVSFVLNVTEVNFEEVVYIDRSDKRPSEKTLCSSFKNGICSSTKTFKTGEHNISIIVLDEAGNSAQRNMKFNLV